MIKSNELIKIIKDPQKSYIWIKEKEEDVGILMWHYKKKKWVFEDLQKK